MHPLTFAYNMQVQPSMETNNSNLVPTRTSNGLVLPEAALQDTGSIQEGPQTPLQKERDPPRKMQRDRPCLAEAYCAVGAL